MSSIEVVKGCSGPDIFVLGNHVQACCLQVPRTPKAGETLLASAMEVEPGGKGLNVAVALARQGWNVGALFAVGRDAAGEGLQRLLAAEGMSRATCLSLGPQSGFGVGLIGADGQNSIAVFLGANALLTAQHVRDHAAQAIRSSRWVYCPFELAMDAVRETLVLGRAAGAFNVVNPSPFVPMDADFWDLCDGVLVNETEAQALLGLPDDLVPEGRLAEVDRWIAWFTFRPQLALARRVWRGQWLVVTLGEQGALMWRLGHSPVWVAAPVVAAIDTVGCGDAFASGFLTVWARTRDPVRALSAGNACGARMATKQGVLAALPDRIQLANWLDKDGLKA